MTKTFVLVQFKDSFTKTKNAYGARKTCCKEEGYFLLCGVQFIQKGHSREFHLMYAVGLGVNDKSYACIHGQ